MLNQVHVRPQDQSNNAYDQNHPCAKTLCGVLCGKLEEGHRGEYHTDTRSHGGANKSENQLNVGDHDSNAQCEHDHTHRDHPKPCRRNVVRHELCGPNTLVSLSEEKGMDGGSAREYDQGEGHRHANHKPELEEVYKSTRNSE